MPTLVGLTVLNNLMQKKLLGAGCIDENESPTSYFQKFISLDLLGKTPVSLPKKTRILVIQRL